MYLIIYGPEGSGKGTQAKLLSEKLNLPVLTSGDLVRSKAENETTREGKICRRALESGHYVPDSVMFKLWQEMLSSSKAQKGFILDGFPRNLQQAKFLGNTLADLKISIDYFIYLILSDSQARKRLLKRKRKIFAGSQISHDTLEKITRRLISYRKKEIQLLDFFKKRNLLLEINADQPVKDVFRSIIESITKVN